MRSGLPGRGQRQLHRQAESRIRARELAYEHWRIRRGRLSELSVELVGRPESTSLPCLASARPQLLIQLLTCALRDRIDIFVWPDHGKNCRTRSRHERGPDFRLLEQPHFELREKNKFLKNRALKIIDKSLAGEFLRSVREAGNFLRLLPARVGPFRSNSKFRLHQQDRQLLLQFRRLDQLAASTTNRGRAKNEKRNVRTDCRSKLRQIIARQFGLEEFIQRDQSRGRIAAAAAQARAVRTFLF